MTRAQRPGEEQQQFHVIGLGSCGSVFGMPAGTETALKQGGDVKALWNDFCLTNKVYTAFLKVDPRASQFFLPDSDFWHTYLDSFPPSHRKVGAVIEMDRILPLPRRIREGLIDRYFDEDAAEDAKNNEANRACLMSVQLADEMAIGLAVLHWKAGVDAMDMEFVLGSAGITTEKGLPRRPDPDEEPYNITEPDSAQRAIHMWVLDFDKSTRFERTLQNVVQKLVPASLGNDPYYPRPDVDRDLWTRFGETYRKASRVILESKKADRAMMKLPLQFLKAVEKKIEEHADWDPEKDIDFG
ncbi:hypothetical protein XPA_006310 [Xanthoria parietina]